MDSSPLNSVLAYEDLGEGTFTAGVYDWNDFARCILIEERASRRRGIRSIGKHPRRAIRSEQELSDVNAFGWTPERLDNDGPLQRRE